MKQRYVTPDLVVEKMENPDILCTSLNTQVTQLTEGTMPTGELPPLPMGDIN